MFDLNAISSLFYTKKKGFVAMFQILFLSICYAISFYSTSALIKYCSPLLLMGVRFLLSGSIILAFQFFADKENFRINKEHTALYVKVVILGFFVSFFLASLILDTLPVVDTSLVASVEPLFIYILARMFFKEVITKKQFAFLLAGTIFTFLAVATEASIDHVALLSWKGGMALIVAACFSYGWLVIAQLVSLNEPEEMAVGVGMFCAGIIALLSSFIFETPHISIAPFSIFLFALIIIFGDLIVTKRRAKLSKEHSATLLALISIFSPFIIALHEKLFLHRPISMKFFLILIPALACFIAFYLEESKQTKG